MPNTLKFMIRSLSKLDMRCEKVKYFNYFYAWQNVMGINLFEHIL